MRSQLMEFNERTGELLYSGGEPVLIYGDSAVYAELFAIYPLE